jgi:hypothetical protein
VRPTHSTYHFLCVEPGTTLERQTHPLPSRPLGAIAWAQDEIMPLSHARSLVAPDIKIKTPTCPQVGFGHFTDSPCTKHTSALFGGVQLFASAALFTINTVSSHTKKQTSRPSLARELSITTCSAGNPNSVFSPASSVVLTSACPTAFLPCNQSMAGYAVYAHYHST